MSLYLDVPRQPHPRGRSNTANSITWHVTMLGEVGPNDEGPLPWIERDYTPISTSLDWERGKIYSGHGALTSWLHRRAGIEPNAARSPPAVYLSRPSRTLSVPSLASDDGDETFRPATVLLLLAGTGVVALPQIMAHRRPAHSLGIATAQYERLQCPINVVHSCREDDALLLPEIAEWCHEGRKPGLTIRRLRNYALLLTEEKRGGDGGDADAPFRKRFEEKGGVADVGVVEGVPNATVRRCRLNSDIVAEAILRMEYPFRVVISGNDAFNAAAKGFLDKFGVPEEYVTMLSA